MSVTLPAPGPLYAAWWECQQADGDGHPLVATFGTACREALALLARTVG